MDCTTHTDTSSGSIAADTVESTVRVYPRADVIKDVIFTDLITERDMKNTDSSAQTDNLGAKNGQGDTSTIVAVVLPSHQRLRTIYGLQWKN